VGVDEDGGRRLDADVLPFQEWSPGEQAERWLRACDAVGATGRLLGGDPATA
jgi:hypothetical protein